MKHFKVFTKPGRITFGQETFADVESFITHFDNRPLVGDDTGKLVTGPSMILLTAIAACIVTQEDLQVVKLRFFVR